MKRKYLDTTVFKASNMAADGNIDYKYWFDKSNNEKMKAAASMTAIAFNEPNFLQKKVDRSFFSNRKQLL